MCGSFLLYGRLSTNCHNMDRRTVSLEYGHMICTKKFAAVGVDVALNVMCCFIVLICVTDLL